MWQMDGHEYFMHVVDSRLGATLAGMVLYWPGFWTSSIGEAESGRWEVDSEGEEGQTGGRDCHA